MCPERTAQSYPCVSLSGRARNRRVEPEPVNEGKTVKRDAVRRRAALKTGFDAAPVGRTRLHRSSRIGRGSVRQSAGRDTGLSAQKTGESFGV